MHKWPCGIVTLLCSDLKMSIYRKEPERSSIPRENDYKSEENSSNEGCSRLETRDDCTWRKCCSKNESTAVLMLRCMEAIYDMKLLTLAYT